MDSARRVRYAVLLLCWYAIAAVGQSPPGDERAPGGSMRAEGTLDLGMLWSQGKAVGTGPVRFTHAPIGLADLERIVPYGLMVGGHVCPIDHGYFYPKGRADAPHVDVVAPAAGFIVQIAHRTSMTGSSERARAYDDYALVIEHSGTFYTQYDLLTALAPKVLDALDPAVRERFAAKAMAPPVAARIPVAAGELLGKVGGRSLDFSVVDTQTRLAGFLTPRLYGHYAWRIHMVDPFDYYDEPLRGRLLALDARKVAPPFGKIDYDVEGRLVGNWFLAGSGGYAGDPRDPRGYWVGHLAFAYHCVDPTQVIVSVGDFAGSPRQFGVRGNGPDPAKIGAADGVVTYELVYPPINSDGTPIELGPDKRGVMGVLIAQLEADRRLRVEVFPGKTAAPLEGFGAGARIYER